MKICIRTQKDFQKWLMAQGVHLSNTPIDLGALLLGDASSNDEDNWVVHRFIQERDIVQIYAPQKVGKTHFADALGQAIALGTDLTSQFKITDARSVVIFNGEMRKGQLKKRKRSAERQVGTLEPDGAYCEYVTFGIQENDDVEDLTTTDGQQRFLDLIDECNDRHSKSPHARGFILDSLKTLTDQGDIVAAKWNALFRFLNKLRTEHPWTFIIIHHTNKQGIEAGTHDKAIKLDIRARLTRDVNVVLSDKNRPYFPSMTDDSGKALEKQLARKFSGKRRDAIWFFFMLEDLRDLPPSAGRPFLMEMLPEDNPPRWECSELNDSGLLEDADERLLVSGDGEGIVSTIDVSPNSAPSCESHVGAYPQSETMPTYGQLKEVRSSTELQERLKMVVEKTGCKSRKELGRHLGTDKDGVDYIMKKHGLKNEDIGLASGVNPA